MVLRPFDADSKHTPGHGGAAGNEIDDEVVVGASREHGRIVSARPFHEDLQHAPAVRLQALALRVEAPIFVAQTVLEQAQTITPDSEDVDEKTKKLFEQLDVEDLGKYKM